MEAFMAVKSPVPVGRDRGIARRDPFSFGSLHREIDRLFEDFARGFPTFHSGDIPALVPSMDVTETDKEIEITAELPGLEEKDVQVNLADNVLTIRGEKKAEKEEKEKKLSPDRAELRLIRALAGTAGRDRPERRESDDRQGRAQGHRAEARRRGRQEDRRQVRGLTVRRDREGWDIGMPASRVCRHPPPLTAIR
jgi:HSP20 family molecular chaperone IbpA